LSGINILNKINLQPTCIEVAVLVSTTPVCYRFSEFNLLQTFLL